MKILELVNMNMLKKMGDTVENLPEDFAGKKWEDAI